MILSIVVLLKKPRHQNNRRVLKVRVDFLVPFQGQFLTLKKLYIYNISAKDIPAKEKFGSCLKSGVA